MIYECFLGSFGQALSFHEIPFHHFFLNALTKLHDGWEVAANEHLYKFGADKLYLA
jgi:hypothetical protein